MDDLDELKAERAAIARGEKGVKHQAALLEIADRIIKSVETSQALRKRLEEIAKRLENA